MATMKEEKVITINDEVYNGTFSIGENITIMWITSSDSFKKYYDVTFTDEEKEDYNGLVSYGEWETFGYLIGWTVTDILIKQDENEISIPIEDIYSICS